MTTNGDDKSVRARDIIGSQVITGDNNTATMKGVKVSLVPADTVDIKAELSALRDALASLNAPDQGKLDRALQDAEEEAAKPEPDKDEIGGAIERVVKYAKGASEFGEHVGKLAPRLAAVTSWLGSNWLKILAMAGLTV